MSIIFSKKDNGSKCNPIRIRIKIFDNNNNNLNLILLLLGIGGSFYKKKENMEISYLMTVKNPGIIYLRLTL